MSYWKSAIKKIANKIGVEITTLKNVPTYTFIGLRELPIKTIIDIGANEGQFAKNILTIFPTAIIHSFEPLPQQFSQLKNWGSSLKNNSQVIPYQMAIGDFTGTTKIHFHNKHSTSSSLLKTTLKSEQLFSFKSQELIDIEIYELDSIFKEGTLLTEPDILIKLDVQGFEDRVIKGGLKTFSKASACIVEIGITPIYEEQADFTAIVNLLSQLGFKYIGNINQSYSRNGSCMFLDAVFIKNSIKDLVDFL